jgi:sulfopyruvate decarboxylase TPP-binding subunit
MITGILRPAKVLEQLKVQGVTHIITLPDSETKHMYDALVAEPSIHVVPVSREGEAIPIAAGLWAAGKKPVVSIQNAGLFESGDALRGLAIGINLPLVMFIGYRGYTRHGDTPDTAARVLEPFLHLWRVDYYVIESDDDLERVPLAFTRAEQKSSPVAVLIGTEYDDGA